MKRQIQPKQLRSSDSSLLDDVFDLKYIPFIKLDSMSDQQLPKFVGERKPLMVLLLVLDVC